MSLKLSPNRINLFCDCKRCFWLNVNEGIKRPKSRFSSLPSGLDKKIKEHFDWFRGNKKLPPELSNIDLNVSLVDDLELLDNARDFRMDPVYVDNELDVVVRGGVDDLLVTEDGRYVILDYKTRGYSPYPNPPSYYKRQLNTYNLIFRENRYDTHDYSLLLYYYPDKVLKSGEFVFNNKVRKVEVNVNKIKDIVRSAVETLRKPIPEHNPDCEYCKWNRTDHSYQDRL